MVNSRFSTYPQILSICRKKVRPTKRSKRHSYEPITIQLAGSIHKENIQGHREVRGRANMSGEASWKRLMFVFVAVLCFLSGQPFSAVTQQIDFWGSLWALPCCWWVYNENADALLSCSGIVEQHYRIVCVISLWTMCLIHCLKCDHSCWKWNSSEWSAWGNYSELLT